MYQLKLDIERGRSLNTSQHCPNFSPKYKRETKASQMFLFFFLPFLGSQKQSSEMCCAGKMSERPKTIHVHFDWVENFSTCFNDPQLELKLRATQRNQKMNCRSPIGCVMLKLSFGAANVAF